MMRTLVAGLGNIFHGDDGVGCAVAQALVAETVPPGVVVRDFGIRGVHLAYELLDGYDLVVMVDAVQRGAEPGTIHVIEHKQDGQAQSGTLMDAHDMAPDEVLALVPMLGGVLGRVVIVGCEPETIMPGIGLSATVASSVRTAVRLVLEIVHDAGRHAPAAADAAGSGGG
jgi:hydrogenase maturation protease